MLCVMLRGLSAIIIFAMALFSMPSQTLAADGKCPESRESNNRYSKAQKKKNAIKKADKKAVRSKSRYCVTCSILM